MRLFVAVDPGATVIESVARAVERARDRAPTAKWAARDGLHVTLVFLGEVEDARVPSIEEATRAVAAAHAPVALRFAGAGAFGSPRRPRVAWVGVGGDDARLAAIQGALAAALVPLGHAPEDRDYHPHLTIARSREPRGDAALAAVVEALAGEPFGDARCDDLVLYRSELGPRGARYTVVARAPLAG